MQDQCYIGDARDGLRSFIAAGIRAQTCVTSPPYWGLRDYGAPGQYGLEPTPAAYLANMVVVFRLVRDVLTDDGTLWLNMGDGYVASGRGLVAASKAGSYRRDRAEVGAVKHRNAPDLKPKDLVGMPWRLALALQADGWYLRSDIIWHKPNPMPESVTDRPTKAHEYLFLLSKSERYYYDQEAIKEPASADTHARRPKAWDNDMGSNRTLVAGHARKVYPGNGVGFGHGYDKTVKPRVKNNESFDAAMAVMPMDRNKRSVWTIPTEPFPEAHFATFPAALVEPCILAGSRVGDVVFDPFMGSGTVAQVAQDLGRKWIGCELNPAYVAMQAKRTAQCALALIVA